MADCHYRHGTSWSLEYIQVAVTYLLLSRPVFAHEFMYNSSVVRLDADMLTRLGYDIAATTCFFFQHWCHLRACMHLSVMSVTWNRYILMGGGERSMEGGSGKNPMRFFKHFVWIIILVSFCINLVDRCAAEQAPGWTRNVLGVSAEVGAEQGGVRSCKAALLPVLSGCSQKSCDRTF